MGFEQSSSSLARFVGQAGSDTLYGQFGANAPFYLGIAAMFPAFLLASLVQRLIAAEQTARNGRC